MRDSWSRQPSSGYEIVRIEFDDRGEPQSFKPFMRGFLSKQQDATYAQFGRPTGLAVANDRSLLVGDDTFGTIYHITYDV